MSKSKGKRGASRRVAERKRAATEGASENKTLRAIVLVVPLVLLGYLVFDRPGDAPQVPDVAPTTDTVVEVELGQADMEQMGQVVNELWNGAEVSALGELPAVFKRKQPPIYLASRSGGKRHVHLWSTKGENLIKRLANGVSRLRKELGPERQGGVGMIEIDFSHDYREIKGDKGRRRLNANIYRGVRGLEIRRGEDLMRYAPTRMVATNRGPKRIRQLFSQKHELTEAQMDSDLVSYRTFEAEQVLVRIGEDPRAHLLLRGNEVVDVSEVTKDNMEAWAQRAIGWLRANVHDDGRMTYLYWAAARKEAPSKRNNMIRQWMATVALGKYAADREDQAMWDLAEKNIDYNLAQFYREEGDLGMIEWNGKAKLGAMGLAAIAMVEHPKREKWADKVAAIRRSMRSLWHEDGSFTTFLKPKGRSDNENFYPGEALLFWAILYDKERDAEVLDRFMKSFRYYRKWHLDEKNRNPAFTPWHTQAYFTVWQITKDDELRDFVFEMNDWLLSVQQWDDVKYADTKGRFYAPNRPYGPPHASSTGVYIEGLIDAYALAKAVGDSERAEKYRVAMVRGMRSQMQLQFADDVDMFYVADDQRKYVLGGTRTTVYDNQIRCDNVQHPLMGILKVLRKFEAKDFEHP